MKREFAKPYIMVDNSPKGTIQNIAMFNDCEEMCIRDRDRGRHISGGV